MVRERDQFAGKHEETALAHRETEERLQTELAQLGQEHEQSAQERQEAEAEVKSLRSQLQQVTRQHQDAQEQSEILARERDQFAGKHEEVALSRKETEEPPLRDLLWSSAPKGKPTSHINEAHSHEGARDCGRDVPIGNETQPRGLQLASFTVWARALPWLPDGMHLRPVAD